MDEKKISNLKIFPTSAGDERKQNQRTGTHFFFFTLIWTAFICLCVYLVGGVIVFSKIRSVSGRPNNRRSYYHVKYYKYCIGWDLFFFLFCFFICVALELSDLIEMTNNGIIFYFYYYNINHHSFFVVSPL